MLNHNLFTKKLYLVWAILLLGGLLTACAPTSAATAEVPANATQAEYAGKKIVWVDSYHQGYEWSDGIGMGIEDALAGTGVELKVIRMDTKRNQAESFGEEAGASVEAEIEAFKPDVVIATDDNAQKYLVVPYLKNKAMPVVFAGVNWDATAYGYPASNVTGMIEVELPFRLIEHLKNYAEGDKTVYLTVDTETERKVADVYNDRFFNGEMRVEYVKTWDELKDEFVGLQQDVDIIFFGNNAGIDHWNDQEAEKFFQENTNIPTGTINPWLAPYTLITLAKQPQEQGEWAVQAALKIIDGASVSDIPVAENKKGNLILNLDMAEKLDIVFPPSVLKNAEIYSPEE